MHATVLEEPELEFGNRGRHIDPRFGIMNHGPLDAGTTDAPDRIRVGIVGWPSAIEGLRGWLGRAREPLRAKKPKYPKQQTLFPAFPGFDEDHTFRSLLVLDEHNMRPFPNRVLATLGSANPVAAVRIAVEAYLEEIDWLAESDRCDVILCARPEALDAFATDADVDDASENITPADERDERVGATRPDFHDQLKAAAFRHARPLQIIRPETWDDRTKSPKGLRRRRVQDLSTRAWNLHTALYYKAGGTPGDWCVHSLTRQRATSACPSTSPLTALRCTRASLSCSTKRAKVSSSEEGPPQSSRRIDSRISTKMMPRLCCGMRSRRTGRNTRPSPRDSSFTRLRASRKPSAPGSRMQPRERTSSTSRRSG